MRIFFKCTFHENNVLNHAMRSECCMRVWFFLKEISIFSFLSASPQPVNSKSAFTWVEGRVKGVERTRATKALSEFWRIWRRRHETPPPFRAAARKDVGTRFVLCTQYYCYFVFYGARTATVVTAVTVVPCSRTRSLSSRLYVPKTPLSIDLRWNIVFL